MEVLARGSLGRVGTFHPVDFEAHELGAAQPAGDQKRQDGAVALAFQSRGIGRIQELVGLLFQKPVPCPHTLLLHPLGPLDRAGDAGIEQAVVGHLARQLAQRRQPQVQG